MQTGLTKRSSNELIYKLFEFEFSSVIERPECFQLFLAHATSELNSEALLLYIYLELLLARNPKQEATFKKLVSLTEGHGTIRALQSLTSQTYSTEISNMDLNSCKSDHSPTTPPSPLRYQAFSRKTSKESLVSDMNSSVLFKLIDIYAKCKSIRKLFFRTHAKYLVNISSGVMNNVEDGWVKLKQHYHAFSLELSNGRISNVTELNSVMTTTDELVESMFGSSRLVLMITLSSDVFPRFKRSKNWIKYVSCCSLEELNKFGVSKSSIKIDPLLLSVADLNRYTINQKDVELAKVLLRDYYHWKPISQKKLSVYFSKFKVMDEETISRYGFMHAFRATFEFDRNALDMAKMFISKQYYTALSHWRGMSSIDYVPLKARVENEKTIIENYGTSILHYRKRMVVFKREFLQAHSLLYDPETGSYMNVFKVCEHPEAPNTQQGYTRAISYGVSAFTAMGQDKCRYSSVFMVNLRGHLSTKGDNPTLVEKQSIKAHVQQAVKNMNNFADKASEVNFEVDDDLHIYRTLIEHQEFLRRNKIKTDEQ